MCHVSGTATAAAAALGSAISLFFFYEFLVGILGIQILLVSEKFERNSLAINRLKDKNEAKNGDTQSEGK